MTEKKDRRRKFANDDKIVRLTISIPESMHELMLEDNEATNISAFIRSAITEKLNKKDI